MDASHFGWILKWTSSADGYLVVRAAWGVAAVLWVIVRSGHRPVVLTFFGRNLFGCPFQTCLNPGPRVFATRVVSG